MWCKKPVISLLLIVIFCSLCGAGLLGAIALIAAPDALGPW